MGNEPIRGTPFDKEMNMIYPQYVREVRDAKLAFVTILIGYGGRPVAYSVNSSLGPIHIPQPPIKREKPIATKTNEVIVATNVTPASVTNEIAAKPSPAPEVVQTETKATNEIPGEPLKADEKSSLATTTVETNQIVQPEPLKEIASQPAVTTTISNAAPSVAATTIPEEPAKSSITEKPAEQSSPIPEQKPVSIAARPKETNSPPVSPTPVVATQSMLSPGKLLIAGAILFVAAVILIFILVATPEISLIICRHS